MKKAQLILIMIIIIAALLRFYKLGENPPSLDWDEASLGYNAYSLLKTGKDEYGNSWPISIRSFNDYKPPLYTYVSMPSILIFGLSEAGVRAPSALAGTLSVLFLYSISKEIFSSEDSVNKKKSEALNIAVISAALFAISPWSLQFSRVAFEANLALFLFTVAAYFLIKAIKSRRTLFYLASASLFASTMYTYHSARLVVPIFLILFAILNQMQLKRQAKRLSLAVLFGSILLIPLLISLLRGSAQARFSTVSLFTNPGIYTAEKERLDRQKHYYQIDEQNQNILSFLHHPWLTLTTIIMEGYFDHFNFDFLFLKGDEVGRHSVVGMGLFYFWEIATLLAGAFYLIKNKSKANSLIFPWLIAAPTASALTTQTPHAVRSLLMLPPLVIISAYGLVQIIKVSKNRLLLLMISVLIAGNLFYYLDLYFIHTPVERSQDWQYGYKQAVIKASQLAGEDKPVIFTTEYDQPHIFFLFYQKIDPQWYHDYAREGYKGFANYHFKEIDYRQESLNSGKIIIGSPKEIPRDAPVTDKIDFINGETAFLIIKT